MKSKSVKVSINDGKDLALRIALVDFVVAFLMAAIFDYWEID